MSAPRAIASTLARESPARPAVRRVEPADLAAIAAVHEDAFPRSAITALGSAAVRRYYDWQLRGSRAVGFVAEYDGRVAGFCFGGVFQDALTGFLWTNRWLVARAVLVRPHLLREARFRDRAFQALRLLWRRAGRRFTRTDSGARARPAAPRSYGILAIATDSRLRSRGIGRALIAAATDDARASGFERMHLSVDPGNAGAVQFYETLGWYRVHADPHWRGHMECRLETGGIRRSGHPPGA
jgi:ribosomal protein S18 acetylase RimI-like enzyme